MDRSPLVLDVSGYLSTRIVDWWMSGLEAHVPLLTASATTPPPSAPAISIADDVRQAFHAEPRRRSRAKRATTATRGGMGSDPGTGHGEWLRRLVFATRPLPVLDVARRIATGGRSLRSDHRLPYESPPATGGLRTISAMVAGAHSIALIRIHLRIRFSCYRSLSSAFIWFSS
jgi:hypothetical protein